MSTALPMPTPFRRYAEFCKTYTRSLPSSVHPTFSNHISTKVFTVLSPVWQIPFKGSKQNKKSAAHRAIVLVARHFLMLEFLYLILFIQFSYLYDIKYGAKIDTFLIIPKIFI